MPVIPTAKPRAILRRTRAHLTASGVPAPVVTTGTSSPAPAPKPEKVTLDTLKATTDRLASDLAAGLGRITTVVEAKQAPTTAPGESARAVATIVSALERLPGVESRYGNDYRTVSADEMRTRALLAAATVLGLPVVRAPEPVVPA